MNRSPDPTLRPFAPLVALLGALVSLAIWVQAVRYAVPRSGDSLEAARAWGLVSRTVLDKYDKGQEGAAWLLGCLLVPLGIWAGWTVMRGNLVGRRAPPPESAATDAASHSMVSARRTVDPTRPALWPPPPWVPRVVVAVVVLATLLRPSFLWGPNPWGSFGLLGEEGVYLGAVQAMRTGRVLYADIAFPYGPLLIQPFDLWLRLAGDTVLAARFWVLLLHALGVLAVAGTVACLGGPRRGPWAAAGAALAVGALAPPFLPVLNGVLLRPALALLPAAIVVAGRGGWLPWPRHHALAGVFAALAAGLSFEVGAVAILGTGAALLLTGAGRVDFARCAGAAAGTAAIYLLPLTLQGALPALVREAITMIRLPALGYQALPYPDVAGVFLNALGTLGAHAPDDAATRVWATVPPLAIWFGLGAGLCGLGARRGHATTGIFVAALCGALLFRGALGRSDLHHLMLYGLVPVVVLGSLAIAHAWERAGADLRAGLAPASLLLILGLIAVDTHGGIAFPDEEEVRLAAELGVSDPLTPRTVAATRAGGIEALPRLAAQVEAITARARRLPTKDGVWFYPSEASYYFLADRAVPSRFLWAYDAATPQMQRRAIAELESSLPRWVFRSADTFEMDHIPHHQLVPLLDGYIAQHYRPVQVLPGATLLERVGLPP